ncbi:beta-lactamase family protein [Sphingomonas donggukensis]|uniref:Beta-lactamase family protein n=1 Tax=Sphingomonas donggukensis TaxID=2949093 RepID=A0ABY4TV13_9SPHN|nr:serine hydrolase [Sphingomonas donggukensis]URW76202.1 beta-lactamase family protein [Sphingomonas donggukensis]
MIDPRFGRQLCQHSRWLAAAAIAVSARLTAQQVAPATPSPYQRAVAAGYKAATYCSAIFNAGRTPADIDRDELRGIYPEYDAIVPTLAASVDRRTASVTVAFDPKLPPRRAEWARGRGCTTLPIGAPASARARPVAPPAPASDPRPWPMGDRGIAPRPAPALDRTVAAAFDRATYGKDSETVGVVVVQDGRIVAERYRSGFGPFVANRTWSVAKSITGSLMGTGLAQKNIGTKTPLALWSGEGDPRAGITYDHALRMASGLHSDTAGNRTDAIYFGGTTVAEQAPGWPLEAPVGTRFRYANNDILLAMLSLGRVMGAGFGDFPTSALFAPLGMTHTVAERDWGGNFVISSQVWSTARDFARLGQFWLQDGVWQGRRILPAGWMQYMTRPSGPQPASGPGYGATMWLFGPAQGLPAGSYAAQGNRGQYIMVIPSRRLVVVRRGEDPGPARFDIAKFAADVAAAIR